MCELQTQQYNHQYLKPSRRKDAVVLTTKEDVKVIGGQKEPKAQLAKEFIS